MTPKQIGRLGLFHIEEAILEVLETEPEGLPPADISRAIGVRGYYSGDETYGRGLYYYIVRGALDKLYSENRVERAGGSQRWKLTEQ
jgi:hypothetical protein